MDDFANRGHNDLQNPRRPQHQKFIYHQKKIIFRFGGHNQRQRSHRKFDRNDQSAAQEEVFSVLLIKGAMKVFQNMRCDVTGQPILGARQHFHIGMDAVMHWLNKRSCYIPIWYTVKASHTLFYIACLLESLSRISMKLTSVPRRLASLAFVEENGMFKIQGSGYFKADISSILRIDLKNVHKKHQPIIPESYLTMESHDVVKSMPGCESVFVSCRKKFTIVEIIYTTQLIDGMLHPDLLEACHVKLDRTHKIFGAQKQGSC